MNIANYILFAIIIIFSFINVFIVRQRTYSINKFLWLYVFLFWGLVPLVQYAIGIFPWGADISSSTALKANLITLLWIIIYHIFYKLFGGYNSVGPDRPIVKNFTINRLSIILLLALQLLIMIFFYFKLGGLVLLRGDLSMDMISSNSSLALITTIVLRSSSFFIAAAFAYYYKSTESFKAVFLLTLSFSIFFLTNFPLSIARYMAGAFYIGILFIIKPTFNNKHLLSIGIVFLFLVVYPAFSILRAENQSVNEINLASSIMPFLTGDFDNFTTLSITIDYVSTNSITYGKQLLGVLLFFIPSKSWIGKPIGSGAFIATENHWDFTNISCPFMAEGYINFGLFGVILFAIIMAYMVSGMDKIFYTTHKLSFIRFLYPVALGMIFFILRGDLLSSFAYSVGFIVAGLMIYLIIIFPSLSGKKT